MEKKDYYSLREILLGLRDEYLNHYKKVERLKAWCTVDKNRIADFDIVTSQNLFDRREGKLPILSILYKENEEKLNMIRTLLSKIGLSKVELKRWKARMLVSENGSYHIYRQFYDNLPIQVEGKEFFEKANAMIESEFANYNNMNTWFSTSVANREGILLPKNVPGKFQECYVSAFSSSFGIRMSLSDSKLEDFDFTYRPRIDSLELSTFGKDGEYKIDEDVISELLAIEFPTSELTEYQINAIESSNISGKDILIECPETNDKVNLDIQEDQKQLVLYKTSNSYDNYL